MAFYLAIAQWALEQPERWGIWAAPCVVVIGTMTGALEKLSRNQMNALAERAGGKSPSSVSGRTSLPVTGEKVGSKRAEAARPGVRIATPGEFAVVVAAHLEAEEETEMKTV